MTELTRFLAISCCFLGASITAYPQDAAEEFFEAAEYALERANSLDAALLSPDTFARGLKQYNSAKSAFDGGGYSERIARRLGEAEADFRQASVNAEQAAELLSDAISARVAAANAEAARLAPTDWATAETQLKRAASDLEAQKRESAFQYGAISADNFRMAELNAIKARYLTQARRFIADAEELKVEKYAPRTLSGARRLLDEADMALSQDRYQTQSARALADQASAMARRAIYIAGIGARIQEKSLTIEDLILDLEEPIIEVADTLDIEPDLTQGYSETNAQILQRIEGLLELPGELSERNKQIRGLEDELRELDSRLQNASSERRSLVREIEDQARAREKVVLIDNLFTEDEAIVLQDGENIVLRLVGLNFATNSSNLKPDAIALVRKSGQAIDMFPQSRVTIEGHTDSSGQAKRNLELSTQRAQAVVDYMTEELKIAAYRLTAVGYGDARPIANNKTAQDRARNRRIDVIIVPSPDSLP